MLSVAPGAKVYLAAEAVDLWRGDDGLCALVRSTLALDPFTGHFFVFIGKRGVTVSIRTPWKDVA